MILYSFKFSNIFTSLSQVPKQLTFVFLLKLFYTFPSSLYQSQLQETFRIRFQELIKKKKKQLCMSVYFKDKFVKKQEHFRMGKLSSVCTTPNVLANLVLTVTSNGAFTVPSWKQGQIYTALQTKWFCKQTLSWKLYETVKPEDLGAPCKYLTTRIFQMKRTLGQASTLLEPNLAKVAFVLANGVQSNGTRLIQILVQKPITARNTAPNTDFWKYLHNYNYTKVFISISNRKP